MIAVMFIALPIVITPAETVEKVKTEVGYIKNAFGVEESEKLLASANAFYDDAFVKTGVIKTTGGLYVGDGEKRHGVPGLDSTAAVMTQKTNEYLLSMSANIYALSIRIGILLAWLPYIIPFLSASIVHGLVRRKIKMRSFGFVSPTIYGTSLHALIAITFIPVAYLLVPFAVSPLFIPLWAILSAIPLGLLVANLQRIN